MMSLYPDPDVFRPEAIEEDTRELVETLEAQLASTPPPHRLEPQQLRDARERGESVFGPLLTVEGAEWRSIPRSVQRRGAGSDLAEVRVRVIPSEGTAKGVYLHLHGGGWMLGAAHHSDVSNLALSRETGLTVISVDYRLAPEHPYPAGLDDCEDVAVWLVEHAAAELGSDRLLIGGESAGAHLAVCTMLRLRDRHGYRGFRAANLVYGCYDLSLTPSAAHWGERNLILSTPTIQWFVDHYLGSEASAGPQRLRHPDLSPLYADLHDLPPALFTVGTLDPLLDDSLFMHSRWVSAGNSARLAVYPGAVHAFNYFRRALGERADGRARRFLARRLEEGADP